MLQMALSAFPRKKGEFESASELLTEERRLFVAKRPW